MKFSRYFLLIFISSCVNHKDQPASSTRIEDTSIMTTRSYAASIDTATALPIHVPLALKKPHGIYQTTLPWKGTEKMIQTVAFNTNNTYQLQEQYKINNKDSIITIEGSWSPSDGYIWLYKDQIVRGRYQWKGDSLQYFNPKLKKDFPMQVVKEALQDDSYQDKEKRGIVLFGTGNEPLWSIEMNSLDTISFLISDWDQPLKVKVDSMFFKKDSTFYTAQKDSVRLKLTVLPFFCSDGMNEYIYRNKIKVEYNNHLYQGCGVRYKD